MYLESLDIHGFKSFAKKTRFAFNEGITAIVGPNGCGKSNIVDAIRWVLGEQKAGVIRSERMENVIFNGAKTVKPLGMAEVSLTIHNTRNVLPIQYSEVVITRRLFRSLESQYLLNNTPCRLKDIQDLFMDTGMGPDAYSIIELSMVETILNGKPDERRRIFEEAAGVTKYKIRRKAAFRKLEATEADLLRVNDIISEIEKNVNSLQRQVRKARRYQEIRDSLKEREIQLATHQFSKIKQELEPLIARLNSTQDERVALAAKFDEKEAEIEESRMQLLQLEKALSAQQKELNELSLQIQKQEEAILVDRERRRALETAKIKLIRDKAEITDRLEKNKQQIVRAKEELQNLFEKIQVAENDYQEKNAELKSFEVRLEEKNNQLKGIENQRLRAVEGMTESKKDEERFKTQLENTEERLNAIARELEENDLLAKIRHDKITKLGERKTELAAKLQQLGEEQNSKQQTLEELQEAKEKSKESILNKRAEIQTLKERIQLLKKFIESYEDHPEGVQHLLLGGYLNGGCKGTVSEILNVKSTYRRAIETALGEAAVSLVVDATDQAMECIEILKSNEKGNVTFFPLDKFANGKGKKTQQIQWSPSEGVVDWAYNLVECQNDYRSMVRSLLSDYLVVENLRVAKEQAERLQAEEINLITLDGEIVSTWGLIKGGANGAAQTGIVGRKALVEELERDLKTAFQQLESDERQQNELEGRYKSQFDEEQELTKKIKALQPELTGVEVQIAQLEFEAKKESEARERLLKDQRSHQENKKTLEQRLQSVSPSLHDLEGEKFKFEANVQQISDELFELQQQVKEARAIAQDSRVKLVDLKGEERHLQEGISKLQEFGKELTGSILRIEQEMETSDKEYDELEKRIDINKQAIEVDFEKQHHLQTEVHKLEQKYLEGKENLEAREKLLKGIRNEKEQVSEELHSTELRVSELKLKAEKITDRIKDEYGIEIKQQPWDDAFDGDLAQEEIENSKQRLESMGPVNLLALKEYEKEKSRLDFLQNQKNDLLEAQSNLNKTITVINKTAREQFNEIFEKIQKNFTEVFKSFFQNGQATLKLAQNEDPLEAEVIIEADPKGRRISALSLLSGGEKTLTAISLLFSIYLVKPSPFCILDEVDAPLDDANIGRFVKAIREFSQNTQFIIVTHNKLTMRAADCLYGVTMQEEGVSKVVSVNFKDMEVAA